mmetsp:Transcript_1917/g.6339  ORF Transcript_1917/g.6339 Transcript_1917/m.6339 type:complete len:232 (-) Transcript_1917:121-816(-)
MCLRRAAKPLGQLRLSCARRLQLLRVPRLQSRRRLPRRRLQRLPLPHQSLDASIHLALRDRAPRRVRQRSAVLLTAAAAAAAVCHRARRRVKRLRHSLVVRWVGRAGGRPGAECGVGLLELPDPCLQRLELGRGAAGADAAPGKADATSGKADATKAVSIVAALALLLALLALIVDHSLSRALERRLEALARHRRGLLGHLGRHTAQAVLVESGPPALSSRLAGICSNACH